MDQSHKKNSSEENQLDLAQIFQIIFDFKIIIISIISLSIASAIYIAQSKPILFKSIALLEIGHYYDSEGERKDLANIHELIDDLKSEFNYRKKGDLDIFAREPKILQIETPTSSKNDDTLVQELINSTKKRHQKIIQNHHQETQKSLEYSIDYLKNEIYLIKNSLITKIDGISDENLRIKYNLDYEHKIYNLENNLIPLETKKRSIQALFDRSVYTSQIGEIESHEILPKKTFIIFLGFIAGFTISISLVLIKYVFENFKRK